MRVLHVIPSYLPAYRYGGPIWSVHNLNKWLVRKGVEVTVYTTNIDGNKVLDVPAGQEVVRDGVKIYYWPVSFRPWQYSSEMRKSLAKNISGFDLVHITSVFLSASTLGAYYARKYQKSYIVSPRGSLMLAPLMKKFLKKKFYLALLEERNLTHASAIHFTSDLERKEYGDLGLPCKSALVIPNGLGEEELGIEAPAGLFRSKFNIARDRKIVLFLSRISWKKGLDTLIPAFALVKKDYPEAVLVIAGGDDEGYKENVQLLITNYQLQDSVIFTDMLLGKEKTAAYKDSDVFVLPSYSENFGQVVLEAMHFGLPVVLTPGVGVAHRVEQAGAGLVVKKEKEQLKEAILRILQNKSLASKMGEQGRKLIQEEFSWPEIAGQFIKAYNNLISKSL